MKIKQNVTRTYNNRLTEKINKSKLIAKNRTVVSLAAELRKKIKGQGLKAKTAKYLVSVRKAQNADDKATASIREPKQRTFKHFDPKQKYKGKYKNGGRKRAGISVKLRRRTVFKHAFLIGEQVYERIGKDRKPLRILKTPKKEHLQENIQAFNRISNELTTSNTTIQEKYKKTLLNQIDRLLK